MKYTLSYWENQTFFKNIDAVIIGSGIVGLTAALHLRKKYPKWRITVWERGAIPSGASTRNAGFACFGSLTELMDDLTHLSESEVFGILEKRWSGLARLRELTGDRNIGFQQNGGYEMFTAEEKPIFEDCKAKMQWFNEQVGHITGVENVYREASPEIGKFGFSGVKYLIKNTAEGQVNTGKMMETLLARARKANIEIVGGMEVLNMEDVGDNVLLETAQGWQIRAAKVLVAVNGFAKKLLPDLPVRPARNQVLITQPIKNLRVKGCFHYQKGYFYFRNIDNRILLGGGRNLDFEGETTAEFGQTPLIQNALTELLQTVILPEQPIKIDAWWSGILGLGDRKVPIIQKVSENVGVAVRLSGMGVAIGTLIGQEGAELIC